MIFVRTFKGYEDKILQLDAQVNAWIQEHGVKVVDVKIALGHEPAGRSGSGDLIYAVIYEASGVIG